MSIPDLAPPPDPWAVALAYLPLIKRVAREYRHGPWDTDDLIQEGLIGARNAALRYDTEQHSFWRMVEIAVRNRMRDWLRWRHRDRRSTGDATSGLPRANRVVARADRIDAVDLADTYAEIELLPARPRSIIREHFGLHGPARTEAAIAVAMGTTRDAVAQSQYRALVKVRKRLGVAP